MALEAVPDLTPEEAWELTQRQHAELLGTEEVSVDVAAQRVAYGINAFYEEGAGEVVLRGLHAQGVKDQLSLMVDQLGLASLFNLISAVRASQLDGVGGDLTIHIPRKVRDRIEVDWTSTSRSSS